MHKANADEGSYCIYCAVKETVWSGGVSRGQFHRSTYRVLSESTLTFSGGLRSPNPADTHTHTHTQTETHTHRQRQRHTHTHTHTQTDRDTHTQTETHTHRERHIHTETHTHRDTHTDTHISVINLISELTRNTDMVSREQVFSPLQPGVAEQECEFVYTMLLSLLQTLILIIIIKYNVPAARALMHPWSSALFSCFITHRLIKAWLNLTPDVFV